MSIEYQDAASRDSMNLATALAAEDYPQTEEYVTVEETQTEQAPALPEAEETPIDWPEFLMTEEEKEALK